VVMPWEETGWKVERPDGRWLAFVVFHPSSKRRSMDGAQFHSLWSAKPVEDCDKARFDGAFAAA